MGKDAGSGAAKRHLSVMLMGFVLMTTDASRLSAQTPGESEVRQIVTFSFLPGKSAEAIGVFRDLAIPLYEKDDAMLSFRGFREIESSIPLDLMVVSSFNGMAGMDASNAVLRMGAFYGAIVPLISGHTDQFVEMLPELGSGDPSSRPRTAFVWYRILPGQAEAFESILQKTLAPWEEASGIPSSTGRFLLSDGWHYMRILGFDTLGDYEEYWSRAAAEADYLRLANLTVERREVIVTSVPELRVR